MYYQNYEDYMRSVLGYPVNPADVYTNYGYQGVSNREPMMGYDPTYQNSNNDELSRFSEEDIKDFYPEIYHLVSPVVNRVCDTNQEPLSRNVIDRMTEEVYSAVEEQSEIIINARTESSKTAEMENTNKKVENRGERNIRREEVSRETQREERQQRQTRPRNSLLRDLIRILILNRIFGGRRPPRPRPPRPPFPGGPGRPPMGPGRPPMRPRDYSDYIR
ncbi:MAG: hypothetical protein IJ777_00340 [Clostridia bacterium]|nr:hypothetical protein [Clostridia bacterium]